MYLLKEQDYASRLRRVGQRDADEIVELFNGLMKNIKNERLKNLEQKDFLSKLIEASPMGIAVCDYDGKILTVNGAYRKMLCPEVEQALGQLGRGDSIVVRSGRSQIFRCSHFSFMDFGFSRSFYLVEQMTDEIMRAEKLVFNKIVRTMGHEVNNTLGCVVSVLETMEDIHADDEFMAATLRSCCDSCSNLTRFVKGYSDVVKLPEANLTMINFNDEVNSLMPFLREMADDGIEVSAELESEPVMVSADIVLLQRVIVNIVKNSIESIRSKGADDGRIVIRSFQKGFEVIDNGGGISRENASLIFTPFFSTKNHDRGLGLMLISDVLHRHNASFSLLTSDTDGLTRFTVNFSDK